MKSNCRFQNVCLTLNLIDICFYNIYYFYCITSPKLCLHPLAPSFFPIIKSLNEARVGLGTTIIYVNFCFNFLQL